MASMNGLDNTASAPPRDRSFDPLPPNKYSAMVTNTVIKDNSQNTGKCLKVEWLITGPTHVGRKIFQNINVRHSNAQTEQIGQQELAELKEAVGITGVMNDSTELHNKPVTIKLKIRPARDKVEGKPELGQYEAENAVSYVRKLEGGAAAATGFTPPSAAQQAPAAAPQQGNFETATPPAGGKAPPPWATQQRAAG